MDLAVMLGTDGLVNLASPGRAVMKRYWYLLLATLLVATIMAFAIRDAVVQMRRYWELIAVALLLMTAPAVAADKPAIEHVKTPPRR